MEPSTEFYTKINDFFKPHLSITDEKKIKGLLYTISIREVIEKLQSYHDEEVHEISKDAYLYILFMYLFNHRKHPVKEIDYNEIIEFRKEHPDKEFPISVNNVCTPSIGLMQEIYKLIPCKFKDLFIDIIQYTGYHTPHYLHSIIQFSHRRFPEKVPKLYDYMLEISKAA